MSILSESHPLLQQNADPSAPLWKIPIAQRPAHGRTWFRIFALPTFLIGFIIINACQAFFIPLWVLKKVFGQWSLFGRVYEWGVDVTKQMFGILLLMNFVLYAPTSLVITTPPEEHTSLPLSKLVAKDPVTNKFIGLDLPKNLVIMSNHQAYLDWMVIWILGHLSVAPKAEEHGVESEIEWTDKRHGSASLIILLKKQLKNIPVLGWGMQFYHFIFLSRSWATDKHDLTLALSDLAARAKSRPRAGLWLLIFPEGTITSDEERAKSVSYSTKEGMPDYVNLLQPRTTGLQFCLRTLLPQTPDLHLLDLTIGYPGVPRGGYAQEWYGLKSVFQKGISPPTIHIHLRLTNLEVETVPGVSPLSETDKSDSGEDHKLAFPSKSSDMGLASATEAKVFGTWLRNRWSDKEVLLDGFVDSNWEGFALPSERASLTAWKESVEDERKRRDGLFGDQAVTLPISLW